MGVAASGASGLSLSETVIEDIDISGIDHSKMVIRAFLLSSLDEMIPKTLPFNLFNNVERVAPDNENIEYVGRWSGDSDSYRSYYVRPYIKTAFTGTSLNINLKQPTSLTVRVDGDTTFYNNASGMTAVAQNLADGVHQIRISTVDYRDYIEYDGLYVERGKELLAPEMENTHIEFIGNSITAWNNGYSWQVGDKLNVESSRICWPGIALVDGNGYTRFDPLWGLSTGYFKTGLAGAQGVSADVADWSFENSSYTPDIFVINIGTNDCESIWAVPSKLQEFTDTYSAFIDKIRAKYPKAEIFVMRAVSMPRPNVNEAVENMIKPKLLTDSSLHYLDTTDWGVTILNDKIHPDPNGHTIITNKLCEILSVYIN